MMLMIRSFSLASGSSFMKRKRSIRLSLPNDDNSPDRDAWVIDVAVAVFWKTRLNTSCQFGWVFNLPRMVANCAPLAVASGTLEGVNAVIGSAYWPQSFCEPG
ncbi:hypothetical protein OGAPHI_001207 [Ogataea philodendri]|uniref:Uncharacterized protein n=1 Tax=Ogataea philodendri TaxID=1378263 RepID=A0A9P8PG75_9ASCO|nr:uncharacterized protein OGAPHI_001207 [Ogataea philodendri]KAH3670692.1 hypothetical protein OGAPHI_001207 [Ogataea philodendri]